MNLDVTFRNLSPRDEVRRRGEALYGKLERFLDPAAGGHMIVSVEHHTAIVEVIVGTRGQVFKAEERNEDMRTAMDKSFHNVEEQLRRFKDKRTQRRPRAAAAETGFVTEPAEAEADDEVEVDV